MGGAFASGKKGRNVIVLLRRSSAAILCLAGASGCNVVGGALAAAQPYYSAGDLERDQRGARQATASVGCVDVALDLESDGDRTVLDWRMGNRCNAPVMTDLSRIAIVESHADGSSADLALDDPNGEIGPRDLAPRREALERIAIRGAARESKGVCVDVSRVADSGGARAPSPMCFTWNGHWLARGS
jgi:hypothetical protein